MKETNENDLKEIEMLENVCYCIIKLYAVILIAIIIGGPVY